MFTSTGTIRIFPKVDIRQDKKVYIHLQQSVKYSCITKIQFHFYAESEACTLICVLLAQLTCKTGHIIHDIEDNLTLNCMIAKAIIKGNKIHRNLLENQVISHSYLSIEEALFFGEDLNILKEWVNSSDAVWFYLFIYFIYYVTGLFIFFIYYH